MTVYKKNRIKFALVVVFALIVGAIAYPKSVFFAPALEEKLSALQVNLGLDLQGGLHVEYKMDLTQVEADQRDDAKSAVQAVIERRVNAFGVGESLVQVADRGDDSFLIVELPGVANVEEAKQMLQETPFLEFREERPVEELNELLGPLNEQAQQTAQGALTRALSGEDFATIATEVSQDPASAESGGDLGFVPAGVFVPEFDFVLFDESFASGSVHPELVESQFGWHIIKKTDERIGDETGESEEREVRASHILIAKYTPQSVPDLRFVKTELTGKQLKGASFIFGGAHQGGGVQEPQVLLIFDSEGADLFADLTKRNLGKQFATYVDGEIITAPVVQTEITNGEAVITGNFTADEARALAARFNEGALPVPIELVSQQSISASLGQESLAVGLKAGALGLALTIIYMIFYYRFLGLVAGVALAIYAASMVSLFKLSLFLPEVMHVTLSLAGIAGLILSVGMAVDANILIFERIREELRAGRNLYAAVDEGFARAWTAIRDGNLSTILTSLILMWIGTGFVKGFALILILGVLMSMFTAIVLVKISMKYLSAQWLENHTWLIIGSSKKNDA